MKKGQRDEGRGQRLHCLYCALCPLHSGFCASAATFTNNVTLSETNTAYDGQDIIVDGATVTIDGPHSFNSVRLTNNAVLTHSPCTTMTTHKCDSRTDRAFRLRLEEAVKTCGPQGGLQLAVMRP